MSVRGFTHAMSLSQRQRAVMTLRRLPERKLRPVWPARSAWWSGLPVIWHRRAMRREFALLRW